MAVIFNSRETPRSQTEGAAAAARFGASTGGVTGAVAVLGVLGMLGILGVVTVLALGVGAPWLGPGELWRALQASSPDHVTVWQLRAPRAVLAVLVGLALGAVGLLLQDVLRNPLAGPELTGAAPGAACGLACITVLAPTAGPAPRTGAVLLGATLVGAAVLVVATRIRDPLAVAVAGAMVGALVSAITVAVISLASETAVGLLFTAMLGSLAGRTWDDLGPVGVAALAACGGAALLARRVEAMRLGGSLATTVGVRPGRVRAGVFALATVVTTLIVLVCGPVAFVALAAPHLARRLLRDGRTHRVLPMAALAGALLVVLADAAARVLAAPGEVPLGVATALLGGSVLLVVLRSVRIR